jgi:hypothetical protein
MRCPPENHEGKGSMATPTNSERKRSVKPGLETPWKSKTGSLTAQSDLERVLTINAHIPLKLWRKNFWFSGAGDEILHSLTGGEFSRDIVPAKTHPVLALNILEHGVGCNVCPCSSRSSRSAASCRFIRKGCTLRYTDYVMDRNSYLVDGLAFSIPSAMAYALHFKGEVPQLCVEVAVKV